ncbi:MAG: DALR domain-containing protein, partial [Woeseiaceae bacterium]
SLGNVLLVHDLVKTVPGELIRLALLGAHYRQPLDWSDAAIDGARSMLDRFYGAIRGVELNAEQRASAVVPATVLDALEDDLNTPKALKEMFDLARKLNKSADDEERQRLAAEILAAGDLLGILQMDPESWFAGDEDGGLSADDIDALLKRREEARASRDFAAADSIRDQLTEAGITIEDGPAGARWRRN